VAQSKEASSNIPIKASTLWRVTKLPVNNTLHVSLN
jgi:hypothetical protein